MFRQALIATLTVLCTLSRTHGQGTQHLDRIKDVMCVLLLSGMQKEDLDVDVLKKLQHHNVNIDEMNNENLLQECMHLNKDKEDNITEKETIVTEIYKSFEKQPNYEQESNNVNNNKNKFVVNEERFFSNKNNTETKANNDKYKTQVSNDHSKLDSVLKFWQDLALDKTMKIRQVTTKIPIYRKQVNSHFGSEKGRSITENMGSNTEDSIDKFLQNILIHRINKNSQQIPIQRSFEFNDKNKGLQNLLRPQDTLSNDKFKRSSLHMPSDTNAQDILQTFSRVPKNQQIDTKLLNPANIMDMFSVSEPLKEYYLLNPNREINGNINNTLNLNGYPYLNNYRRFTTTDITTKSPERIFSQDIIKEIAESVKKIVLKDLQKEIRKTIVVDVTSSRTILSTTTTQSTTKKVTELVNKTNNKEKKNIEESILNKFLELFEEIKSFKDNAMTITGESRKEIHNKRINQGNSSKRLINTRLHLQRSPTEAMKAAALLPQNLSPVSIPDNGIKQYPVLNSQKIFNFSPQVHKFRSNGTFVSMKKNSKGILPITVQTNNIEIPPLGIPLDQPQNLINQNIIVTTPRPYRIGANKNYRSAQYIKNSKNFEENQPKGSYSYITKLTPEHSLDSQTNEDIIRLTLNNNKHPKYNTNYYEKLNYGNYNKYYAMYEDKQPDIRFHEKLENIGKFMDSPEDNGYKVDCCNEKYAFSKVMIDCCNKKIASRQQMSLNNMKRISYDDIHFKNFLKSQQKVTDMLERVLAEKGKIRSVETA